MGKGIQCVLLSLMVLMVLNTISAGTAKINEETQPTKKTTAKLTVSVLEATDCIK